MLLRTFEMSKLKISPFFEDWILIHMGFGRGEKNLIHIFSWRRETYPHYPCHIHAHLKEKGSYFHKKLRQIYLCCCKKKKRRKKKNGRRKKQGEKKSFTYSHQGKKKKIYQPFYSIRSHIWFFWLCKEEAVEITPGAFKKDHNQSLLLLKTRKKRNAKFEEGSWYLQRSLLLGWLFFWLASPLNSQFVPVTLGEGGKREREREAEGENCV